MTTTTKAAPKAKPAKEIEILSAALKNAKHEAVALSWMQDPAHIGWRAYNRVYPNASRHACEAAFSRLLKNDAFIKRIDGLKNAIADGIVMTQREVLQELSKLGRANMQDFMRPGPDGEPVLDFSELTRDQAAALAEVTVEEFVDGRSDKRQVRRVKFKLHGKDKPLELLGKHHGLFVEKHQHKHQHSHEHSIMAVMLKEIDEESRGPVIEHRKHRKHRKDRKAA